MNFTYENHGSNTYLVCELSSEKIDTMSLGMLTNNNIEGIAETTVVQINDKKYVKYKVSAMVSVAQMLTGPVNRRRLLGIFTGIVDAMLSAEEYMLDIRTLATNLNYIFTDVSTGKTVMICLPVEGYGQNDLDIGAFFKRLIVEIQPDPTESCDHIGKILTYLNSTAVLSLAAFKEHLAAISKGGSAMPVQQYAQPVRPQPTPVQQPVVQQTTPQPAPRQPEVRKPPVVEQKPQPAPKTVDKPQQMQMPVTQPSKSRKQEMAVPKSAGKGAQEPASQDSQEKEISWFYLMQHYNSENAALYKAQKQAKKAAKSSKQPTQPQPTQVPAAQNAVTTPSTFANTGFAIPGQQATVQPTSVQQTPVQPVQRTVQQPVAPQVTFQQPAFIPTQQVPSMNFGETTVLGGGAMGETTVLGASPATQVKPHLIRSKNNEKIELNKPIFRIGKERSYVDYFVSDNSAISRSHANVVTRNDEYFIMDTNSTNHTYINGQMISSNVETKIVHGTKIRLANEEFEFRLY